MHSAEVKVCSVRNPCATPFCTAEEMQRDVLDEDQGSLGFGAFGHV